MTNPCTQSSRTILHIDMDAFFAAVEQRDNPSYRGKPVIVGADPSGRGVVSAASYEARTFGIHSAMPIREAYARCPHGVFVPVHGELYGRESRLIMEILSSFSPAIEQVSVDEAFLDISGTEKLHGDPPTVARTIQRTVFEQRRLTCSIGIAPNKFLAKVASDLNKPNGITPVPFEAEAIASWLAPLPVKRIWGVGKQSEAVLASMGIRSIGDLQQLTREALCERFGKGGWSLWELSRGIDDREVTRGDAAKSISREHTYNRDTRDRGEWHKTLLSLSQDVTRQARASAVKGKTVVLVYRGRDFTKHTRRTTLPSPTCTSKVVFDTVWRMAEQLPEQMLIRLIGVGLTGFDEPVQTSLFDGQDESKAWEVSDRAVDRVNQRFGPDTVRRGGEL